MSKTVKRILNWISSMLVGMVLLLAIALVGVRLVGLKPYAVLSGSMEPTYHVGSLIYVKEVDHRQLEVGDPITYMSSRNRVITHRIVGILQDAEDPQTLRYITQGDANDVPDAAAVRSENVIGKPVFTVPYLGYVSGFIRSSLGKCVTVAAGALLILLLFLPDLAPSASNKKQIPKM